MATASPKIQYALPLDRFAPEDSGFYQIAMSRPNQRPNGHPSQHEMNTSRSPISPPTSLSQAPHTQPPTNPAVMGKRSRSLDEDEIKTEDTFEDDEGRKKRSRGRPRLDTKDETAADRRRTQIRLAQRAYRHRKDTAITTLEKRVKELERANNDMSKEFNAFFGVLVSERVLDAAPHALQRLSSIANKITTTADKARISNSDSSLSDDDDDEVNASGSGQRHSRISSTPAPRISPSEQSPVQLAFQPEASFQQANYPTACAVLAPATAVAPMTSSSYSGGPLIHVPPSVNYEIVTAATPQNASFPFYSSMEPSAADEIEENLASAPSPYGTIAAPLSFAANEQTFGRRLQRNSIEGALRLIMSTHPPPDRFAAVFGFCLFFESIEDIIKRLQLALSRSPFEDLCNWKLPFTNLGGAGTFFPEQSPLRSPNSASGRMPIGNQGTRSYSKPQEFTGMSMGPWGPEVQATRDERIDYGVDRRMQMMLAGFEGDFFDPDEVETYLRQLNIFIPQRADFIQAEINVDELGGHDGASRADGSALPAQQLSYGSTDSGCGSSAQSAMWTTNSNSNSSASGVVDSSCPLTNQHVGKAPMMTQGQPFSELAAGSAGEFGNSVAPAPYVVTPPAGGNGIWSQPMNWPNKVKITLDVGVLVRELTNSSICLGRSPGVRRKDINVAIKVASGLVPGAENPTVRQY
ncbi:hypothetical protein C2857_002525 [Epichloe festucae Fl1]|uniref:BZIP domain-containing protein n=1 Tax=Epichloe festucae (strain Fl1) TaxID=877507 RepID=A0A7U3SML5_EPIFF|nr:hypothetical protein C2857_002525 [Epichloe festucae Fl1]